MIYAIVAVDSDFGIGKNGSIPWKSSADFAHFKQTTFGSAIIMGKNTWISLDSKPLPGRYNMVVSSTLVTDECEVVNPIQLPAVLDRYNAKKSDLYLIGGRQLLEEYGHLCSEIIITRIPDKHDCDVILSKDIIKGYVLYKTAQLSDGLIVEYYRK